MIIFHIIENRKDIDLNTKYYNPKSLTNDNFIHLSLKHQVSKVANNIFKDKDVIFILEIDSNKLEDNNLLVLEDLYNLNEDFPHYYGPLNTNSIIKIHTITKKDNKFIF